MTRWNDLIGYGLVQPLRRLSGSDFVAARGSSLVRSSVLQILGTKPGELPWRPTFGVDAEKYRHRNMPSTGLNEMSEAAAQRLAEELVEALTEWDERIEVLESTARKDDNVITGKVKWTITSDFAGVNVIRQPEVTETPL